MFLHNLLPVDRPDILFVQEVLLSTQELLLKVQPYGYNCESNIDALNPTKPGTAVIWRESVPITGTRVIVECRIQSLTVGATSFLNIYAPSGSARHREREELFATELFQELASAGQARLPWLAGDWNCLVEEHQTTNNYRGKRSAALSDILRNYRFTDVFSHLHPGVREYTFHRAGVAQSRLDRVYCPPGLETSLESVVHVPGLSDHSGVECRVRLDIQTLPQPPRIHTYWKLNTSILSDERFLPQFRTFYQDLREEWRGFRGESEEEEEGPGITPPLQPEEPPDPRAVDWWEYVKPAIAQFCKDVSILLAKERRATKNFLFASLTSATKKEDWSLVASLKERLRAILMQEVQGVVVRSRYQQNVEEERATLFHQNKEVKMTQKRKLSKLKLRNGDGTFENCTISEDEDEIAEECFQFFDALLNGRHDKDLRDTGQPFEPSHEHLPQFLSNLPTLSEDSRELLVAPLEKEEIEAVLKQCQTGKSPGLDGLSYEFYRTAWEVIGNDFFSAMRAVLAAALLPESDQHGVTRLIVKVLGVPSVLDLRPVTLLNCSYKLLSMVLVQRLNKVLPEVITSSQLAMPGKVIMSGGHNLISTIDFINQNPRRGGFVASWDQVKAHDRASTRYLDLVLEAMNFPILFRGWVRMLHEGATTCLLAGSSGSGSGSPGLTRSISVTFSFRQGDPAASPLYSLQQEPFLLRVRAVCSGVRIGRNISSHCQVDEAFCDDETIAGNDINDVVKFEEEMSKFESQSGAILSRTTKSKIMYIGSWSGRQDSPFPWLQVVLELKVFGLVLTPRYESTLRRTWEEVLKGFRKTIYSWGDRGLVSMFQRVEVARTFAQSKLWYVCQMLPLPPSFAKKFESLLSSFLFRGKPERLKLEELFNSPDRGGLGLMDIRNKADSLFLKQLTRMLFKKEEGSYRHLCYWLGSHLRQHMPAMMEPSPVLHTQPPPYHQHALTLLLEGFQWFGLDPEKFESVTAKKLYMDFTTDIPEPKVTDKFVQVNFPSDVWPRLSYSVLTAGPRQMVFDSIHGLTRNRARLFEQGRASDPWCQTCPRTVPLQPPTSDLEHIYCSCTQVRTAWLYVRALIYRHQPELRGVEDGMLIRFLFSRESSDQEVVWLLSTYQEMVQEQSVARGSRVLPMALRGRLRERLKMSRSRRVQQLILIL